MTIALDLPPELERTLAAEAATLHLSLSEYIARALVGPALAGNPPKNGAELVAYWNEAGLIGSRPDVADASLHARRLRGQAQRRTRS